ncbi:MAG: HGGxSTG domain-containing protein [Acidobacteriota bacterium]
MTIPEPSPHDKRQGRLKNGNLPGDPSKAERCGAKTRQGTPCQCPAMANGRCRLHGGLSTGAKTAAGIERIRQAVTKHGRYSKQAKAQRAEYRKLVKGCRELLADLSCNGVAE